MAEITGHAPDVVNGELPTMDERTAIKMGRWQQALEKATTPERRAAVQAEIDKLMGVAAVASVEDRIALLEAELAKLRAGV